MVVGKLLLCSCPGGEFYLDLENCMLVCAPPLFTYFIIRFRSYRELSYHYFINLCDKHVFLTILL